MRLLLLGVICFGFIAIKAQNGFSKTEFDLGSIAKQNDDVIDLNLVNNTGEDVFILRIDKDPRQSVLYSSKLIKRDDAILLRLKFNPSRKGKFEEEIGVYLSSNTNPIVLRFKGDVESLPTNQLQSCPSFGQTIAQNTLIAHEKREVNEIQSEFVEIMDEVSIANTTLLKKEIKKEVSNQPDVVKEIEEKKRKPLISTPKIEFPRKKIDPPVEPDSEQTLLEENYKPNNIVFLIDASTSMREGGKMDLLKVAMIQLLEPLRSIDYLSIVTYSGEATTLLQPTSGIEKATIQSSIENIPADGSTHAVKGIKEAINVGLSNFIEGGNNQIFLASDGAFDIGERNTRLRKQIELTAEKGLSISVIGIKNEQWTNKRLKEIATLGKGSYVKIKTEGDTEQVLEEMKSRASK